MASHHDAGAATPVERVTPDSPSAQPLRASHGERFHFIISYMGLAGAKARISVEKNADATLRITGDVEHTMLLQFIFRIRDRFLAQFSTEEGRTLRTQLWQNENSMQRYREESFLEDRVVTVERREDNERTVQVPLHGRMMDPLSALFWVRGQTLEEGAELSVPTFTNNRELEVRTQVKGRETVHALGKNHQAIKLEAQVYREGQPISGATGTFWVSADEHHLPLRAEANTDYGKVSATLEKAE